MTMTISLNYYSPCGSASLHQSLYTPLKVRHEQDDFVEVGYCGNIMSRCRHPFRDRSLCSTSHRTVCQCESMLRMHAHNKINYTNLYRAPFIYTRTNPVSNAY